MCSEFIPNDVGDFLGGQLMSLRIRMIRSLPAAFGAPRGLATPYKLASFLRRFRHCQP